MPIRPELSALREKLDLDKSRDVRNKLGQNHTPWSLATDMVNAALSYCDPNIKFLDPAFGLGTIFNALLEYRKPEVAVGIEIDAQYGLSAASLWADTNLRIRSSNFLKIDPDCQVNMVVCDPPFTVGSEPELVDKITSITGIHHFPTNVSLAYYFMLLSHAWLEDDGIGVWLLPSNFEDCPGIIQYLLNKVCLLFVHKYDDPELSFSVKEKLPSVVIFRKSKQYSPVIVSGGGSMAKPNKRIGFAPGQLWEKWKC